MSTTKRRLIPGGIELHPTECALVVHYSVLEPNQQDPTPATKTIALKSLSTTTDLVSLAADVAAKCKLIHPNKVPRVEQLLAQLVQRHAAFPPRKPASSSTSSSLGSASPTTSSSRQSPRVGANVSSLGSNVSVAESILDGRWDMTDEDISPPSSSSPTPSLPAATLDQLDFYLDLLYEDLPAKLDATRSLLSLALTPSNLAHLAANDSLLPALARTLREDTKRSMQLSATILAIFHQYARHDDDDAIAFRDMLKANKVGDLCLRQLELEVHRTSVVKADAQVNAASIRQRQDAVIYEAASVLVHLAENESPRPCKPKWSSAASSTCWESTAALLASGDSAVAPRRYACGAEALKVMLNLSHDAEWRAELMRVNLLSCDERSRAVFTYTDAMPIVRKMVLKAPIDQPPSVELMTLAINLALNEHNAEQFAENGGLKTLVKRLVRTRDYLVLKLVRNMSLHPALHLMFVDHLDDLVSTFLTPSCSSSPDLVVELFGTLANLRHPSLNFAHLLETYPSLLPLLTSTLTALKPTDTLTVSPSSPNVRGSTLGRANVPDVLLGVMRAREDDDEMVLQVLLAFSHLLLLPATRAVLLPPRNPDVGAGAGARGAGGLVAYLIDLMYDRNAAIRGACMRCLDIVCDLAEQESTSKCKSKVRRPAPKAASTHRWMRTK
ncbi:kinesin-associated protein-domain-containing protein [Catenaria anguillulae PL171]|uniref:Kinesin-associated protein-domain-containing protein n=1 Tax=Catenaria anguillulae PL171 TaxID=765915 RepID=A0A1Y2HG27_9FUNG|nr:kinesin-associated protein-domain-containing protein [Catenaria anguillulae PL171]